MKVTSEQVTKLIITGVQSMDPVAVYLEDHDKGQGKVTITCFNESWSYYWGAMGENNVRDFLSKCDTPYLAGKFSAGQPTRVVDDDAVPEEARKHIIQRRKSDEIHKEDARRLFEMTDRLNDKDDDHYEDLMFEIFGDEWYDCRPSKPCPKYEYLCRIVNTVKEALKQSPGQV